jgi:hypothetical protein
MAIAIAALFGWLFSTINVAAPIDRAYAFLYPYVKPYNSTYAWIGVEPREGAAVLLKAVEVDGVLYPINETVSGLTWLMPVPCGANVTFLTQYGSASRADTWRVACMNREAITQLPMPILTQLASQLLAVGITNPAVSFDYDPSTNELIIHNLNNLTWLVAWSLPNNGIYSSPPTINYKILEPYGTIEVPMMCGSNAVCTRGLNFYLLYPINASNITAPLFSTPSPVLEAPIGVTPYGVIAPGYSLANAPVQYAKLSWLSTYTSLGVINSAQAQDILSSVESGGFVLDPAPINNTSLQAYAVYYFERQPYADVYVNGKLITAGDVVLSGNAVYVYNASLCGANVWNFPGTNTLQIGSAKYSVSNLTVTAFGFNCKFNQGITIRTQSYTCSYSSIYGQQCYGVYTTYSPAALDLTFIT